MHMELERQRLEEMVDERGLRDVLDALADLCLTRYDADRSVPLNDRYDANRRFVAGSDLHTAAVNLREQLF